MIKTETAAYYVLSPDEGLDAAPIFFDSPHSGKVYPEDFKYQVPFSELHSAEDAFVDELYSDVPKFGAELIAATFPRSYIDTNRDELDFDLSELTGEWEGEAPKPTIKTEMGKGLVWMRMKQDIDIYDQPITTDMLKHRIETFWRPYHDRIAAAYDAMIEKYGYAYHIDCHSMPNAGVEGDPGGTAERADFVLGDRDGTTCEPGFTAAAKEFLESKGYSVAVNDPYKGAELVYRYGKPDQNRHSLQIEINRKLYMDQVSGDKIPAFDDLKVNLTGLTEHLTNYAKSAG